MTTRSATPTPPTVIMRFSKTMMATVTLRIGAGALSSIGTGNFNMAVGENAGDNLSGSDSNNIDIGANVDGVPGESNTIRIGNTDITDTFIKGISGTTVASGAAVLVAANGHLGTAPPQNDSRKKSNPWTKPVKRSFRLNRSLPLQKEA